MRISDILEILQNKKQGSLPIDVSKAIRIEGYIKGMQKCLRNQSTEFSRKRDAISRIFKKGKKWGTPKK